MQIEIGIMDFGCLGLYGPVMRKSDKASMEPTKRGVVRRKDGSEFKRTTIYLRVELARKLAVYCAQTDRDMSEVIDEALEKILP